MREEAGREFGVALSAAMRARNLSLGEMADGKNRQERLKAVAERAAELVVHEADSKRWGT